MTQNNFQSDEIASDESQNTMVPKRRSTWAEIAVLASSIYFPLELTKLYLEKDEKPNRDDNNLTDTFIEL